MNDPRQPVLVGCAQITQREPDPRRARSPIGLMIDAARAACADSGDHRSLIGLIDTLVVIRSFADTSWRFECPFGRSSNPPRSVAHGIDAPAVRRFIYTRAGGNMPQWCLNRLGEAIQRGETDCAIVVGAEALATQKAAQRSGFAPDWSDDPGGQAELWGDERPAWSDIEDRHGMRGAIYAYPLFENAIRGALGRDLPGHQQALGRLLERFATVAAANPLADRRAGYDAAAISTVGPDNPYIGFPYTRLMNANAFIDQAAAVIIMSSGQADTLGIEPAKRVYLHGCADAHDHWFVSERRDFHSSPAMQAVFARALDMAELRLPDIGLLDLYSCFASAVEVACDALGIPTDDARGLTVTGGLPYFGGPGNNYVTHAIAEMMVRLRQQRDAFGLVTANGNYLTKHSAGVYSCRRPLAPFAPEPPAQLQSALDRIAHPPLIAHATGRGHIETWTVMNDRSGPCSAIVYGRLDNGARFIANTPQDPAQLAAMQAGEQLGRPGVVVSDGGRNIFTPE